jgi:YhcG PDDEXK nuclease domain
VPEGSGIERDFEDAILRELEMFLLELGAGFSFIARQKRIQLDGGFLYRSALLQPKAQTVGRSGTETRKLPGRVQGLWNSTSAGWRSMRARTLKVRLSELSFAPKPVPGRSSS